MTRFGDGLAVDADLDRAAERAVEQALAPLDGAPDLVCVFASPGPAGGADASDLERAGRRAALLCSGATLIGCSAPGVIGAGRGVEGATAVSAWAAVLPGAQLRSYHLEVIRLPEGMAVIGMPERAAADEVSLLLADPYSFPADGFVQQANEALQGLPLVGGLATGAQGPGSTRLFIDDRVVDRGAVGVVIGGGSGAFPMVSQGCRPIGPTMVVTRSDGNAVLELAGVPALAKLQEIVDGLDPLDQALVSQGVHFGIVMDEYAEEHERGDFVVRGVVGADRDRAALVISDVVDVGRTVRFQVRDAGAAEDDLRDTIARSRAQGLGRVEGALLFACEGRGSQLFGDPDHDVVAVRRWLDTASVAGFLAAGELGPVAGRNHVHSLTASMLAFHRSPAAG
ncbi:MAG: FIST N-terminal domain-containing protein [Frankiaceae bacterium]